MLMRERDWGIGERGRMGMGRKELMDECGRGRRWTLR